MSVIFFLMLISSMSHVAFKKYLCRRVDFKSQGSLHWRDKLPVGGVPVLFSKAREASLSNSAK